MEESPAASRRYQLGYSGGELNGHTALVVELLRGVEIERIARHGSANAFFSNVLQTVIDPRVGHGEDQRAVALHKNVFLLRGHRQGFCAWLGIVVTGVRRGGFLGRCGLLRGSRLLCRLRRTLVSIKRSREIESPVYKRNDKARTKARAAPAAPGVGMCRKEVRIVEAEPWHGISIKGQIAIREYRIHRGRAMTCPLVPTGGMRRSRGSRQPSANTHGLPGGTRRDHWVNRGDSRGGHRGWPRCKMHAGYGHAARMLGLHNCGKRKDQGKEAKSSPHGGYPETQDAWELVSHCIRRGLPLQRYFCF